MRPVLSITEHDYVVDGTSIVVDILVLHVDCMQAYGDRGPSAENI